MDVTSSSWPSVTHMNTKTDWTYCTTLHYNTCLSIAHIWDLFNVSVISLRHQWLRMRWAGKEWRLYLCSFDFVSSSTAPASEIRQNFTFFSIQTRFHLTPPLLLDYRSWTHTSSVYTNNTTQHRYEVMMCVSSCSPKCLKALQSICLNITFIQYGKVIFKNTFILLYIYWLHLIF